MTAQAYHYIESGLDNVYLYNISIVKDGKDAKTIYIPKINLLHKVIAQAIILKKGMISNKEIRFLRTEMGLTQSEFSELLGKDAQTVGRWERGENMPDKTSDTLMRMVYAEMMKVQIDIEKIPELHKQTANDNINIDGYNSDYKLMCA